MLVTQDTSNITFSPIGFGLMGFTWRPVVTPDNVAFAVMKEALNRGATFWNSGSFYNLPDNPLANIKLVKRYFDKYPEDAEKVTLSIKGCVNPGTMVVSNTPEEIRKCIDEVLETLDGKVKIGIFECARLDSEVPIEDSINTIAEYVKAGKVGGIGLSEVNEAAIRAAAKVHPIAAVEVELSLVSTHIFDFGIAKACADLGIPVVAYSPLGMGLLSGKFSDAEEGAAALPFMDRFQAENLEHNFKLYHKVKEIADSKGATPAQIAIAWILHQSGRFGNPIFIPIPGSTTVARVQENTTVVKLSDKEFEELDAFARDFDVKGGRYNEEARTKLNLV